MEENLGKTLIPSRRRECVKKVITTNRTNRICDWQSHWVKALFVLIVTTITPLVEGSGSAAASPSGARPARLVFMRHSVRTDQRCAEEREWSAEEFAVSEFNDNSDQCVSSVREKGTPKDPSIRNCQRVRDAMTQFFSEHQFRPVALVTSPFLRTMQTAKLVTEFYEASPQIFVEEITVDYRFAESLEGLVRDYRALPEGQNQMLELLRHEDAIWPQAGGTMKIVGGNDDMLQPVLQRELVVLEAVKELWRENKDTFVVTHGAWMKRLMDMCFGQRDNLMTRRVSVNSILVIERDGTCHVQTPPGKQCDQTTYEERPSNRD